MVAVQVNLFARTVLAGLLLFSVLVSPLVRAAAPVEPVSEAIAQTKANVVFMRHALAPGYGDPEYFSINDCSTQRNLDAAGRRQAEDIGRYFRKHNVIFTSILSSRWCRCTETAERLNIGDWTAFDGLNSFFQNHADRKHTLRLLNTKLDSLSSDDRVLMITHQVVINAITGISPPSGGLVVYNTQTREAKAVRVARP